MSILNNNTTVTELQNLAAEWAKLFEKKAPLNIHFHVTPGNMMAVNGIVLCPVSEIDASSATYDVEYIHIPTTRGSYYEIYLDCPYEGPCKIGYIKLISTIYSADSAKTA